MLTRSEVLIDDIQVIQDPAGEAIQVIQNGTFDADISNWTNVSLESGDINNG